MPIWLYNFYDMMQKMVHTLNIVNIFFLNEFNSLSLSFEIKCNQNNKPIKGVLNAYSPFIDYFY